MPRTTVARSPKTARSPGQRRYEESNPWSLLPQHRETFAWANLSARLRKKWEDAAAKDAADRQNPQPLHFATPRSVSGGPVTGTVEARERGRRTVRRG